jgi:hypothetical protein
MSNSVSECVSSMCVCKTCVGACVCVYVRHAWVHVCVFVWIYTLMKILLCWERHTYIHACMHTYIHACLHTSSFHACISQVLVMKILAILEETYVHTCMHTYMHACMHTYMDSDTGTRHYKTSPQYTSILRHSTTDYNIHTYKRIYIHIHT